MDSYIDPAYRNTKAICDMNREVFQTYIARLDDPKFTADEKEKLISKFLYINKKARLFAGLFYLY